MSVQELKLDCIELQARIVDKELAEEKLRTFKSRLNKKYQIHEGLEATSLLRELFIELGRLTVKE